MPRKAPPSGKPDRATLRMVRGPADEQAVAEGCRFDDGRADHAVRWIEETCHLYEGEEAGRLIRLMPWQKDFVRRLFGWVRWHAEKKRWYRRFNRAVLFVPKKNGKSPLLAAIGLYLFIGEGEQGQKVYSAAKDGSQAIISHAHAEQMVKKSPALSRNCKIHGSTHLITHGTTNSQYKVIAGDNIRGQEGLNGSVMIDEVHVVDRRLADVLRFAGDSRAEPLQVEVSTAGNDPSSYGKGRFDFAQQVIKEGGDTWTLCVVYAAPQDLTHAELDADPEKYGRTANPSWGVTIDPAKWLAEYQQAKKSLSALLVFLMYKLNIWQQSASPWLREADWQACGTDYAEEDLVGRECWAGLDLSKTRDMSSLVLCFHDGEESFKLLPYFWLPEERARELNHLAPLLSWERSGHLFLTPGSVIDYGFIKSTFRRLAAKFAIKELAYDRTYANELTQSLEQGEATDGGVTVVEGTGVTRFEFKQNVMEFAAPTADFERAVLARKMQHPNHPVLNWQAGHVKVRTDPNRNKRPVKPGADDHKSIDGVVAAIMALARATRAPRQASVYDSQGIFSL